MTDPRDAALRVKALSIECGFPLVGIAPVVPSSAGDHYRQWLELGYHGTMAWLERHVDLRLDPGLIVPGARSIVALATPYKTKEPTAPPPGHGKVSNYAWGDDYHLVIRERLTLLWERLRAEFPDLSGRAFVDTGPVLEREVAALAGIGWIGKNTLLLTKTYGSYVFLAEIISTLVLEPDFPSVNHCGTCTRCLEVCPTDAFPMPYVLDSRKCISYLTIEHRGEIDPTLAAQMGSHVYGCDLCQTICPWNSKAPATLDPAFHPRVGQDYPELTALAEITEEEYMERTRRSAMKRAKREGLRRNARIALGNGEG